ncbi:hypothetical protein ANCDUO_21095, partial [Ancylostoma duodenale]
TSNIYKRTSYFLSYFDMRVVCYKKKLMRVCVILKQIPEDGWPDHALELFLSWLACHDTNNRVDITTVGAGEREGRVVCSLVRKLHC